MITKLYYSVQNGGDGSAYPTFMESEELAEWDQDHLEEGWGESCNGSLEIESDGPIIIKDIETKESYFFNMVFENDYKDTYEEELKDFYNKFFTKFPNIELSIRDCETNKKYKYIDFLINNNIVYTYFSKTTIKKVNEKLEELKHKLC